MSGILEETQFIMKKYKIRANKSLGQNFLINQNVVDNIVGCSNITKDDLACMKNNTRNLFEQKFAE